MTERTHQHLQPFARIKVSCSDWNGASVVVKYKTNHPEDEFDDSGDIITENGTYNITFS